MPITAPLKLSNSFVHLALDAMLRSDMEKDRQVAYIYIYIYIIYIYNIYTSKGVVHAQWREGVAPRLRFHFDQDD